MGLTPLTRLVKSTRVKTWWRVRYRFNLGSQFSCSQIYLKDTVLRQQWCALSFVFLFFLFFPFSSTDSVTIRFTVVSTCQTRDRLACPSHLCHGCCSSEHRALCFGAGSGAGLGCPGFCHSTHFDTAPQARM